MGEVRLGSAGRGEIHDLGHEWTGRKNGGGGVPLHIPDWKADGPVTAAGIDEKKKQNKSFLAQLRCC